MGNERTTDSTPPPEPTAPRPARGECSGDWIGPYKLLELLGEGGFGTVWFAERREPMVQRVALKIIKPGMDSKAVIARFEQERQALAVMDHPNIAKVFDGGVTPAGRPFFVMEHVKGAPITEYCDTHRLTVEQRLRLFAVVCEAVQHAHMKGIIHRDLKPSNILIAVAEGNQPRPVVIDFGVAKALAGRLSEHTIYTTQGQFIGTPEYMSPEQAEMAETDIDTRSDVYSLGVVLYELLTGAVPFDARTLRAAGYAAIQRIIREADPPRPSTRLSTLGEATNAIAAARHMALGDLAAQLRRELEWIPLKALRKDRIERYRSASELADDVANYLAHRPLIAGPESAGYKALKFVKRNKGAVAAAGAIAATLVAATGVSVWFGVSEARQRAETEKQRAEAVKQRGVATANAEEAKAKAAAEAKARTRAEAINAFVTKALRSSDPYATGRKDATIAEAMGNAIDEIESGAFRDDPESEAGLRDTIGIILLNNGKYAEAQPLLEQALSIRERMIKGDDALVATSLNNLAELHRYQGRYAQAEPLYKRALAIHEKSLGQDPSKVAIVLNNLAQLYGAQGQYVQAEPLYKQALAIHEKALGLEHPLVATDLNNLALLYATQVPFAEAEPLYTRALAIFEKAWGEDHPEVATCLFNLANLYYKQGQYAEAEPCYTRALTINEKALGPDHPKLASSMRNLARCLAKLNRLPEGLARAQAAADMAARILPDGHPTRKACDDTLADIKKRIEAAAPATSPRPGG